MVRRAANRIGKLLRPAIVLAAAWAAGPTQAQTVEWNGGIGLWRDFANWTPSSPFDDSAVLIDSGEATIYPSESTQVGALTIGAAGALVLHGELAVTGDLVSHGRLAMGGPVRFSSPRLTVSGNSLLSGSGTTVLSTPGMVRRSIFRTQGLTIDAAHTVTAAHAEIQASTVNNRGVIESSGWLSLVAAAEGGTVSVVNAGVMRVVNGGRLVFDGSAQVDNRLGRIDVVDGTLVSGNGSVINGTVKGHGANSILSAMVQDATLQGTLQSSSLAVGGTVMNDAILTLRRDSNYHGVRLIGTQDAFIDGQGRIEVASGDVAELTNITLGSGQTFIGAALSAGAITNHGLIQVRGSWTLKAHESSRLINRGSITVGSGSILELNDGRLDNTGGTLTFEGTSGLLASREGWVSGGTVKTSAQTWLGDGVLLDNVTLPGELVVGAGQLGLRGLIQVSSTLSVGSGAHKGGVLRAHDGTVLSGAGITTLARGSDGSSSIIESYPWVSEASSLTVDTSHTLKGEGAINVRVSNKGLMVADAGAGLRFGAVVTNTGTIRSQGGDISLHAGALNKGGLIEIAQGRALYSGAGVIEGGVLQAQGSGARMTVNELRDVTLKGSWRAGTTSQYSDASIGVSGAIHNEGVLRVGGTASNGDLIGGLVVRGSATLMGPGSTELAGVDARRATLSGVDWVERSSLTNARGHTLVGHGHVVNLDLLNRGLLDVQGGVLSFASASLRNEGRLVVHQGATLSMQHALVQDGSDSRTIVSGRLETPWMNLVRGELSGQGVIHGALNVTGGSVRVGGESGALTIEGNFSADDDSTLVVALTDVVSPGQTRLFIDGHAALAGLLVLEFGADAQLGDSFDILYGTGLVSGAFSRVDVIGSELKASVSYFSDRVSVSLVSSVPEPGTPLLALIGAAFVMVGARRMHRAGC